MVVNQGPHSRDVTDSRAHLFAKAARCSTLPLSEEEGAVSMRLGRSGTKGQYELRLLKSQQPTLFSDLHKA